MKLFRPIFIKAAWKAYVDIEQNPISKNHFQNLIAPLFDPQKQSICT
jgi:hypothetical protein